MCCLVVGVLFGYRCVVWLFAWLFGYLLGCWCVAWLLVCCLIAGVSFELGCVVWLVVSRSMVAGVLCGRLVYCVVALSLMF